MIAIASYRESLSYYSVPELVKQEKAFLESEDMYHPMLENPVANTIKEERGVLVTGSNASGKSTFLKTVAISAVFAQTIHTCPARQYRACYFQIYSSMALKDNLQGNELLHCGNQIFKKNLEPRRGEDTALMFCG